MAASSQGQRPDVVDPHEHSVSDLPVGTGPGRIPTADGVVPIVVAATEEVLNAVTLAAVTSVAWGAVAPLFIYPPFVLAGSNGAGAAGNLAPAVAPTAVYNVGTGNIDITVDAGDVGVHLAVIAVRSPAG